MIWTVKLELTATSFYLEGTLDSERRAGKQKEIMLVILNDDEMTRLKK
jgi:hypothetical protein